MGWLCVIAFKPLIASLGFWGYLSVSKRWCLLYRRRIILQYQIRTLHACGLAFVCYARSWTNVFFRSLVYMIQPAFT